MQAHGAFSEQDGTGANAALLGETARRYDACHPDDSFADLARRAAFSKEDRCLMQDWLDAVALDGGGGDGA